MFDAQLEMSFEARAVYLSPRKRRLSRAQWWFQRMRQVVDRAVDWHPIPPAPAEQMWLPAARLQPQSSEPAAGAESSNTRDERQICE